MRTYTNYDSDIKKQIGKIINATQKLKVQNTAISYKNKASKQNPELFYNTPLRII